MYETVKKLLYGTKRLRFDFPCRFNGGMLIIAPHPDDETLGCGGVINKYSRQGIHIEVLILTDGIDKEIRHREFVHAMKCLGNITFHFAGCPEGKLMDDKDKMKSIFRHHIEMVKPELILLPYILDKHVDHKASNRILAESMDGYYKGCIGMYEVWTPILYPNCYVDVTAQYDRKIEAIKQYTTQEEKYKLMSKTSSVNRMRASLLYKDSIKFVESYSIYSVEEHLNLNRFLNRLEL